MKFLIIKRDPSYVSVWQVAYCSQDCINLHSTDHKGACDDAVRMAEEEREKEVD